LSARRWIKVVALPAIALLIGLGVLAGCGSGSGSSSSGTGTSASGGGAGGKLTIVGYSVAREVYGALVPAFQATPAGQGTSFDQSYGASGEQSRAVASGLEADVVAFSLEPDITRLVDAGLVDADWNAGPTKGFVSDSVVVFVTRKGNPKGIKTWADLTKSGIQVITPNPFTSGAAQWNILAGYGAESNVGKDEAAGLTYLQALFKNVPVQPASGREALQVFEAGKGDVLLSYENDAIAAQKAGAAIDYTIPNDTILIQNPVAVVNSTKNPASAQAFVDFLLSAAGQKIYGENGYRPTDAAVAKQFDFPTPSGLFTIDDLGGWSAVKKNFFDPANGKITKIFQGMGIATGK
jgi:sulfate/thiosulfate transport system substrate-binding protein